MAARSKVRFEEAGATLTAVEIGTNSRSPVISRVHQALFALGIVVSSYQLRTSREGLVERVVMERRDGGAIQGALASETKAALLPIVLQIPALVDESNS